jgi:hypothetical protein
MGNINDTPLLFHMESLRKKILDGHTNSPFVNRTKQKLQKGGTYAKSNQAIRAVSVATSTPVFDQKENYVSKILIR